MKRRITTLIGMTLLAAALVVGTASVAMAFVFSIVRPVAGACNQFNQVSGYAVVAVLSSSAAHWDSDCRSDGGTVSQPVSMIRSVGLMYRTPPSGSGRCRCVGA